jgi:hypothetical protein
MYCIKENCLEWSLNHLKKYYDSDFYPKLFEFKAIAHNWDNVKNYILSLDIENYLPSSPILNLAPKSNINFRVVHQLDPIDSLIFTALVYELSGKIESYRIPEAEMIACSYRIKTDLNSFFDKDDTGYKNYISRIEYLSNKFKDGFILFCDITDFYNQIYTHRIQNIISEVGYGEFDLQSRVLENFLLGLNKNTSRGVPVGPAASIVLAEAIMSDIDKKIMNYTREFVRWVDDIRIFTKTREEAITILHDLSRYLYSSHRLVLSSEKTSIETTELFIKHYYENEEKEEQKAILDEVDEVAKEKIKKIIDEVFEQKGIYGFDIDEIDIDYDQICKDILTKDQFKVLSKAYNKIFKINISKKNIDIGILRYVLRKATILRVREILPIILDNFEKLVPVLREIIIYLNRIINPNIVIKYCDHFRSITESYFMQFPFINHWISYLLQNKSFNSVNLPEDYKNIITIRDKTLIALRKNDVTWVKDYKDNIDILGVWDRRAVLFSSQILSYDEMSKWSNTVAARGDIIDKSIASYILSIKKNT